MNLAGESLKPARSTLRGAVLACDESESSRYEIAVEGKSGRHAAASHHKKADVIHQTDLSFSRSSQLGGARGVEVVVHPREPADYRKNLSAIATVDATMSRGKPLWLTRVRRATLSLGADDWTRKYSTTDHAVATKVMR